MEHSSLSAWLIFLRTHVLKKKHLHFKIQLTTHFHFIGKLKIATHAGMVSLYPSHHLGVVLNCLLNYMTLQCHHTDKEIEMSK